MSSILVGDEPLKYSYIVSYVKDNNISLISECHDIKELIETLNKFTYEYENVVFDVELGIYNAYFNKSNHVRINDLLTFKEMKEYRKSRLTLFGYYQYKYQLNIVGTVYYKDIETRLFSGEVQWNNIEL